MTSTLLLQAAGGNQLYSTILPMVLIMIVYRVLMNHSNNE